MNTADIAPTTFLSSSQQLDQLPDETTLGALLHHRGNSLTVQPDFPLAQVHSLRTEDNPQWNKTDNKHRFEGVAEVWVSSSPVTHSTFCQWQTAQSRDYLFATANYPDNNRDIADNTQQHYQNLFELVKQAGFAQMLRLWNYIPDINGNDALGQERYRTFCLGRSLAFSEHFTDCEAVMPAATGIGSLSGNITIALLAKRTYDNVHHIENPRQIPAYRYPSKYGPRAPSFARATSLNCAARQRIYISGTAAVRGSETVFPGDTKQQLNETLKNISALVSGANLSAHGIGPINPIRGYTLADLCSVKVYYRYPVDLPTIKAVCERSFSQSADLVYLHTDVCRADLDIEIEGVI